MTATKAILHTKSVKKRPVNLTIESCIEEFEPLMKSYKPGENFWSDGASSKLAPSAVWMLRIYPNGETEKNQGCISVFLHLSGPMKDARETLDATYRIYLVDAIGCKTDVGRWTSNFGEKGYYGSGQHVDHERVKKALQADGSLRVTADIEFLGPYDDSDDGGVEAACKECALRGDDVTQKHPGIVKSSPELHSDKSSAASSNYDGSEIEKRLIEKLLSAEKVVVMAKQPGSHPLETLKKACIELIARTGRSVYASAAWKELTETKPELAADLAEGVATAVIAAKKP